MQVLKDFMPLLLKLEGGYVNDPRDPGKETNFGVTQRSYDAYCKKKSKPLKNVKEITQEEVFELYLEDYFNKIEKQSDPEITYNLFDAHVNGGYAAYLILLDDIKKAPEEQKITACYASRASRYKKIYESKYPKNSSYPLKGWLNRLKIIREHFSRLKLN